MPGGRLTHDQRHYIAAGLAGGASYTEIARDLGRPASTVSREVLRNGGPAGYQADAAQLAAERRARRPRPARAAAAPAGVDAYGRDPQTVREFADGFTALLVGTGLPRMAARVLVCLYTADSGSLTAADLVRRLSVSPASISTSIRYLEDQAWVRRDRRGRRERYLVDDDIWYRAFLASARRNAALAEAARRGATVLGTGTPAGGRLAAVGQFLGMACQDMTRAATRWRDAVARDNG
ncbi:helix-turn-helix domain-containing protein [Rugosimonospora acidiphila]|uniref:Helix-turn-helix domain-containing protein n=1 Tax=Rugosimonospora acidiphila TaxID=556531 RepID=A0ABP9RLA9_9ACTN